MKISACFFIVLYLLFIKTAEGNAATSDQVTIEKTTNSSASTSSPNEESCLTRLDRVERKVELQSNEMAQLKHEHEELKSIVLVLKNERKAKPDKVSDPISKIEATLTTISPENSLFDSGNLILVNKRPARLLPYRVLIKPRNMTEEEITIYHDPPSLVNKRPARLLPYRVLIKPRNMTEEEITIYHDPPTNCQDLRHIGYTLSGYYLVQFSGKIGTIYCNFKQSTGIYEKRIGVMNIRSSPIHFYVQRKSPFSLASSVIPYEVELLNEGRAIDMTTGVFRAPVNGVYHFSFRGFAVGATVQSPIFAYIRVNRVVKATSTTVFGGITLSIECTLKLKRGDLVDTKKGKNGTFDDNNVEHLTHFFGSLLEEDISLI